MMYADRDYDLHSADSGSASDRSKPFVTVESCVDKGYTVVNLRCPDRPKLLFDTVCTLTDMQYVVYHATVIAEGPEAYQVCPCFPQLVVFFIFYFFSGHLKLCFLIQN